MKRKFASLVTGVLLLAAIPMQTLAADASVTTQTTSEAGVKQATVSYTQDSSYTVTIPKEITLSDVKTATYNINVKGDIKYSEKVTVTPDLTVTMKDEHGKNDVTINVTQEKTEFTAEMIDTEAGDSADGSITGTDLTAGSWTGTLNFTIEKTNIN
mgnify:CR=1 FL=1